MARKSEVTAESVAAAAAAIMARGENVSNKGILAEIGSGSMSTVVPLLAQWREEQVESAELADVEMPDDIAISGEQHNARMWRAAMKEATAGHEGIRRDLLASRAETEAVRVEMVDLLATVEADRDAHEARADGLTGQLAGSVERGTASEVRAVAAEREAAALTERAAAKDAEAATARDAAQVAQDREKAMREERDAATAETAKVRAELSAELKAANAKIEQRTEKLEQAHADLGAARSDLSTERAQHEATRGKLADMATRSAQDAEAAKAAIADVRGERDTARQELVECREQRDTARSERDDAQRKIVELTLKAGDAKA